MINFRTKTITIAATAMTIVAGFGCGGGLARSPLPDRTLMAFRTIR